MTVWFIEDERMLLEIFEDEFDGPLKSELACNTRYVTNVSQCKPEVGDLVIHDLIGIGGIEKKDGVHYLCVSGSIKDADKVDIFKPYHPKDLLNAIIGRAKSAA